MSLEEEIKKAINEARMLEKKVRLEKNKRWRKEYEITSKYFRPIKKSLIIAKSEFEKSSTIEIKIDEYETSYIDIDLNGKDKLYRIGASCAYLDYEDKFRISYLISVRSLYEDIEYFYQYYDQGSETDFLKKLFSIIAKFETNGYLTKLDCE